MFGKSCEASFDTAMIPSTPFKAPVTRHPRGGDTIRAETGVNCCLITASEFVLRAVD